MKNNGKYYKLLYLGFLIIGILLVTLIWSCPDLKVGYYDNYKIQEVNQGWFLLDSGESIKLPVKLNRPKGVYTNISKILTEDAKEDEVICFRTDHTFVRAYADGKRPFHGADEAR